MNQIGFSNSNSPWDVLSERLQTLESIAESRKGVKEKVDEIHNTLERIEKNIGDMNNLEASNIVDSLNMILSTINVMRK